MMQHNPYYHHHQSFINKRHSYLAHHSILSLSPVHISESFPFMPKELQLVTSNPIQLIKSVPIKCRESISKAISRKRMDVYHSHQS